jgi:hypothetical protein
LYVALVGGYQAYAIVNKLLIIVNDFFYSPIYHQLIHNLSTAYQQSINRTKREQNCNEINMLGKTFHVKHLTGRAVYGERSEP